VGKGFDSAEDHAWRDIDGVDLLEHMSQRKAEVATPAVVELEGACVAVNGTLFDFVDAAYGSGRAPVQKFLFDGGALGMAANSAFALVARGAG